MRWLPLFLCCACASTREVAAPKVALPASPVTKAVELGVTRSPCPLKRSGTPGCQFVPATAKGDGLLSAAVFGCKLATAPERLRTSTEPALLVSAYVLEGHTSYGVRVLRAASGALLGVPDELSQPGLLDGALIGLSPLGDEPAFWKDDVCESVPGGRLVDLAVREGGEVIALQQTPEKQNRVLLRARDGQWSALGPLPFGVEPFLRGSHGRVSVLATSLQPPEWTAHFPDLARTLVLRRTDVATWERPRATAELSALPGTRFSPVATLASDAEQRWSLRWPGAARLELPLPVATRCPAPEGSERPSESTFVKVHAPDVAALSDTQLLVSWFEEKGRCRYSFVEKQPVRCELGQPCIDTPPGHWELSTEALGGDVVVARVAAPVRELSRIAVGPADVHPLFSTTLAVTPERVVVTAGGYLLEYDRRALEAQ